MKFQEPKKILTLIFLTIFLSSHITFAQNNQTDSINTSKLLILGGVTTGALIYGYGIQNTMWWKGDKSKFHLNWKEDWNASLGADKIGHFYFGTIVSNSYSHAFRWAGFSKVNSLLYSGLFTFSYQTLLEIRDGFSKNYGFSWGDFSANFLGSMYPYFQYKYPLLDNFNLKISYQSSERFKNGSHSYIIDDYESTYHWLSIDVNNFLPAPVAKVFPDIINFAIGHSVNGLSKNGKGNHEFFIGLDWDLEALPGNSPLLIFLKETLNLYHLPAPTIKIYPNVVWYGLKF